MSQIAGVDVGKQQLDVFVTGRGHRTFSNTVKGIEQLLDWLGPVDQVIVEPTGGYERGLCKRLWQIGQAVHLAHVNKVRGYARAQGRLAKSDRIDAQVLAEYGQAFALPPSPAVARSRQALQGLLRRREQLVRQRVEERHRLAQAGCQRRSVERHLQWLDQEIGQLERAYAEQLSQVRSLQHPAALYQSIEGIGQLTAATLVAELPELGQLSSRALTSLVGLAPWSNDSGQRRGYRSIRGGRARVRKALYMAALAAIRYNAGLRVFYQRLKRRGKPSKVALVAVMRKLLLQLNAVARRGTPWESEPPSFAHNA